jgi:hypothetical protein
MSNDPAVQKIAEKLDHQTRRPAKWVIFVVLGVTATLVLLALSFLSLNGLISERHARYVEDQKRAKEVVVSVNLQVCDILNYIRSVQPSPAATPDPVEQQLRQHISCPYPAPLISEEPTP